jgi:hypothetical protein
MAKNPKNPPDEGQLQLLLAIQRVPGPAKNPMGALPNIAFDDLLGPGGKLKNAIDQKALLRVIFTNQVEAIRFQTGILKEMDKFEDSELNEKMRDSNPLIRLLAIQSASQRRLHCEDELIKRLKDPVAAVREAAHQALVRIARGTDFGPAHATGPTLVATRNAQDEAVARWRQWLKSQSDVSEPTTKSPDR